MPALVAVLAAVALFCVLGVLAFAAGRAILNADSEPAIRDAASTVGFRVGAVHALILGLIFGSVHADWNESQQRAKEEARTIAEAYFVLQPVKSAEAVALQQRLSDYLDRVIEEVRSGDVTVAPGDRGHSLIGVYKLLAALPTDNDTHRALKAELRARLTAMARLRVQRHAQSGATLSPWFWIFYFTSFIVIAFCMGVFPLRSRYVLLISLYSAVIGFLAVTLFSTSRPYEEPGQISVSSFVETKKWIAELDKN